EEGGRVAGVAPPEVLQQRPLTVGVEHIGVDVVLPAHSDGVAEAGGDLLDRPYDGLLTRLLVPGLAAGAEGPGCQDRPAPRPEVLGREVLPRRLAEIRVDVAGADGVLTT